MHLREEVVIVLILYCIGWYCIVLYCIVNIVRWRLG